MYVDDSGSPDLKDHTDYYVISGVIIHELYVREIEIETQNYKIQNFGRYNNCEIHVHDIFKGVEEYESIGIIEKYKILNSLYDFIKTLEMTVISVGIDKVELVKQYKYPLVFSTAWIQLIERFNSFISDNGNNQNKGLVIVDKSSRLPENDICKIVNDLRKSGTDYVKINHLVEEPIFIESKVREGIQLADASAYCTLKHLTGYTKFVPYWNNLYGKLRKGKNGQVYGYGLKFFQKDTNAKIYNRGHSIVYLLGMCEFTLPITI